MLDGDVVSGSVTERILRHAGPIAADVCAVQMKNAHVEPFDAANLALDIGYGGHVWSKSSPTLHSRKQILAPHFPPSVVFAPLRETALAELRFTQRRKANTKDAKDWSSVREVLRPSVRIQPTDAAATSLRPIAGRAD